MAKGNQIQKLVNGEIADANDVNQIVEDAGAEGGSIPYDDTTDQRDPTGGESLGSTAYPWGSLKISQNAEFVEVDLTNHSAAASVVWKNLRKFIYLKDAPSSYVGHAGKFPKVNTAETALEFAPPTNIEIFTASGTFSVPAGITKAYISMCGGGGGGAASSQKGGGGGGASVVNYPFTVTPSASITVTIGAGGSVDADGGSSSFDTLTVLGGKKGTTAGGLGGNRASGVDNLDADPAGSSCPPGVSGGNGSAQSGGSANNAGSGGSTLFGKGAAGQSDGGSAGDTGSGYGYGGRGSPTTGGTSSAGGGGVCIVMY